MVCGGGGVLSKKGFISKLFQNNLSRPYVGPKYIFCGNLVKIGLDARAADIHTDIFYKPLSSLKKGLRLQVLDPIFKRA